MKILNNLVAIFVILILSLIIIPLPTFLLDMMFIINITISLMILLITMYVKEPLQFSIFPSMLLITTLFRLGLNISSTRLILTNMGQAGQVIATFGNFVLQGNVVVGFLVFIIIVLVQFLVITKGSERIAEVSARFTLDAMPGKQMAIDADLNSGLISEEMARDRRYKIQKEADFYGAMDGATKLVKGDAVMSIIITFVNFIAGVVIGMVQGGSSFSEVLNVYSIATVGDGLVSQIPALLISTATGMIVTRAASDASLNIDVKKQFFSQPMVLSIAGYILVAMIFIPGSPKPQFIILAALMIFLGYKLKKSQDLLAVQEIAETEPLPEENVNETEYFKNIDNIYDLLPIDAIEMEFGYSLIPLVDESSGSSFIDRLITFRKQFALDMGYVVPPVRLKDNGLLNPNQYIIKLKGEEIGKGEILIDYYLALDPGNLSGVIEGIDAIEPAYGIPSKWITADKKELAEIYGYTVIDPLSVVVTHLSEVVKKHAYELLSRQDVSQLLDKVKTYNETLVAEAVPNLISFSNMQKVLANLLKEGVPIRDIETILETITDFAPTVKDIDMLTEHVRQALKRTITRKWSTGGQIKVITLDSDVERAILNAINKNGNDTYLALDPHIMQKLILKLKDAIQRVKDVIHVPIVLTSPVVRVYFSKMMEQFYQDAIVLSFNELDIHVQIQAVANITLDD